MSVRKLSNDERLVLAARAAAADIDVGDASHLLRDLARRVGELAGQHKELVGQVADRNARVLYLEGLLNTPRTDEFFEAVRIEAAHQVGRWGVEHDAGKRSEDWVTLLIYLLGKAARAHFDGDQPKLEHHVITTAAVALNWWRHLTGVSTAMRPGIAPPPVLANPADASTLSVVIVETGAPEGDDSVTLTGAEAAAYRRMRQTTLETYRAAMASVALDPSALKAASEHLVDTLFKVACEAPRAPKGA